MIGTLNPPSTFTNVRLQSPRMDCRRKTVVRCTATAVAETRRTGGSLYEVLRVNRNASATEIKSAYRSLAKVYHPDLSSTSSERDFIKIHKAYETLMDPSARAMYDSSLCSRMGVGERQQQQPFRYATVDGGCGSGGFYYTTTRNWETDQCW